MTQTSEKPKYSVYLDDNNLPVIEPSYIGPTWDIDEEGNYRLPELTLGWQAIDWAEENLLNDNGEPWRFTNEQQRFVLWWYAIDENGRFLFQEGVLQRLKGWGKDPLLAVLCAIEWIGPCRFSGFDRFGNPVATDNPQAWIQVAAVSQEQTRNTMQVIQTLFNERAKRTYKLRIGIVKSYAYTRERPFEAVTSSPAALEGGRASFVVKNETHHWKSNNGGHDMNNVISRNLTKGANGASRAISITNAYNPSEDSVAQRTREAYDASVGGDSLFSGLLYDSLEAHADAPLMPDAPGQPGIEAVLRGVRGDALWLDIPRMVKEILDPRTPPSLSRRFWYNQIVAAEDAWADPKWLDECGQPFGFQPGDQITLFGDGSKSHDATGLVGTRISDGHVVKLGVWQRPPGERGKTWLVPRAEVDETVTEIFETYDVVGFFFDPSHTKNDEDESSYWVPLIDEWHRRYSAQLKYWAVPMGNEKHSIMWDMSSPNRQAQFVTAAVQFVEDLERGALTYEASFELKSHLRNARRYPTAYGISLSKRHRESNAKIDLAVCAVGSRLIRRLVLNKGMEETKPKRAPGRIWGR